MTDRDPSPHGHAIIRPGMAPTPSGGLDLGIVHEEWVERAICSQTEPDAFFPERGASPRDAKAVCRECPVRAECLDYALAHGERFGVWGGLTPYDRAALTRLPKRNELCGTERGYWLHERRLEPACDECKAAMARRSRQKRAQARGVS